MTRGTELIVVPEDPAREWAWFMARLRESAPEGGVDLAEQSHALSASDRRGMVKLARCLERLGRELGRELKARNAKSRT